MLSDRVRGHVDRVVPLPRSRNSPIIRYRLFVPFLALLLAPVAAAGQSFVFQGGALAPADFGEMPITFVRDCFPDPCPGGQPQWFRDSKNGPSVSLGVVIPYVGDVSLEAAWDYASFDTGVRLEFPEEGPGVEEGGLYEDGSHRVHVYRAGLRYTAPLDRPVRPHVSAGLGGIRTRSEYRGPYVQKAGEFTETQLAAVLGAGFTVPIRGRLSIRVDARDLIQFCRDDERPCLEEGAHHHIGGFGGVEIDF